MIFVKLKLKKALNYIMLKIKAVLNYIAMKIKAALKTVKRLWKRIPRPVRLGLDLLLIAAVLYAVWANGGFRANSANKAYQRALRNALLPAEAEIELWYDSYAIGADKEAAYRIVTTQNTMGWWKAERVYRLPALDGVYLMQLPGDQAYELLETGNGWYSEEPLDPSLAVKVPGAASVRIELELDDYTDKTQFWPGGTSEMVVEATDSGWFLASFDVGYYLEDIKINGSETHRLDDSYYDWISYFEDNLNHWCPVHACFHISALDEAGEVIKTVTWDPMETPGQ